jgi:hypothetical protein
MPNSRLVKYFRRTSPGNANWCEIAVGKTEARQSEQAEEWSVDLHSAGDDPFVSGDATKRADEKKSRYRHQPQIGASDSLQNAAQQNFALETRTGL